MQLGDIIELEIVPRNNLNQEIKAEIEVQDEEVEVEFLEEEEELDGNDALPVEVQTRAGRATKKPSRYT